VSLNEYSLEISDALRKALVGLIFWAKWMARTESRLGEL
jgi:hypothetical protein